MEVTKHTFESIFPVMRHALEEASFVAMDCEMSGLFDVGVRQWVLDDMETRYENIADSARKFALLQFGLSAFTPGPLGMGWVAKTFNFWVFPGELEGHNPRFLSEVQSIQFLARWGFDFNKCVNEGVAFLPVRLRDARLRRLEEEARAREQEPDGEGRPPIVVKIGRDREFLEHFKDQVTAWLASDDDAPLILDSSNSFQRALQHQELRKDQFRCPNPPGFYVEVIKDQSGYNKLQLVKGDAAAAAAARELELERDKAKICEAAAFSKVLEAIRDSGVPVVGHNAFFDLAYIFESCVAPLPARLCEFKEMAREWLPGGFYDTKYLCTVHQGRDADPLDSSGLGQMHAQLEARALRQPGAPESGDPDVGGIVLPSIDHAADFTRYAGENATRFQHEAGFDAFMTGACFARLAALLGDQPPVGHAAAPPVIDVQRLFEVVDPWRGRLNVMRSDYEYVDLEGPDPIPDRPNVLWLTGFAGEQIEGPAHLSRKIGRLQQGRYRPTILDSHKDAFIELFDVEDTEEYEMRRQASVGLHDEESEAEHSCGEESSWGHGKRDRSTGEGSPRQASKRQACSIM